MGLDGHHVVAGVIDNEPGPALGVEVLPDEGLSDADAGDGFGEGGGETGVGFLGGAVGVNEAFAEELVSDVVEGAMKASNEGEEDMVGEGHENEGEEDLAAGNDGDPKTASWIPWRTASASEVTREMMRPSLVL